MAEKKSRRVYAGYYNRYDGSKVYAYNATTGSVVYCYVLENEHNDEVSAEV